ncbi:MAG TPA: hypothetical protein VNT26_07420, partial [Candidatus Sulfotelmatobacter sp.]|nr:hypothetical protein [Candidatus Sulfotelmatobacter sp.]
HHPPRQLQLSIGGSEAQVFVEELASEHFTRNEQEQIVISQAFRLERRPRRGGGWLAMKSERPNQEPTS